MMDSMKRLEAALRRCCQYQESSRACYSSRVKATQDSITWVSRRGNNTTPMRRSWQEKHRYSQLYRKYIDQIAGAKDHAKGPEKLKAECWRLGLQMRERAGLVSPVIRQYLGEHHKCKKMMDAVSGAT